MKLYLVQHGEAVPESVDPNRPLTDQGREDIVRLASFLQESGVEVARVINSGKIRARTSADILATAIAPGVTIEDRETGLLPKDSTEDMADATSVFTEATLIVGHQPFMSRFVSRLVLGQESPLLVDFVPGTTVCLVRRAVTGAWFMGWMVTPDLLRR
ncbi:MAG: phosphohistidine phosphatase SixA [Hyphomicrobiales bacterium]|nr:phosphohistidine phosphatase SixA [Hyphomicrobiales bacterium]